jgi:hypothetical protein
VSALDAVAYRRAATTIARWCEWYTRDLDPSVAKARRDEVESDLHEHGVYAEELGISPNSLSRAMLTRLVLGAVQDLSWRRGQIRQAATRPEIARNRLSAGGLPVLAYTLAVMLLVWGGFVTIRIGVSLGRGEWWYGSDLPVTVLVSALSCGLGLMLMTRARTRSMGALWLMIAVYGLVRYGGKALVYSSATYSHLAFTVPGWDLGNRGVVTGLVMLFLAMAIWWWPSRPDPRLAIVQTSSV